MKWILLALTMFLAGCAPAPGGTTVPHQQQPARQTPSGPITVEIPTQPITQAMPTPIPVAGAIPTAEVAQVVAVAESWIGIPYHWGGCSRSPGIDCSCFVRTVLASIGINAPRTTTVQIQWATPVSAADARPLDLVFFDNTCTGCGANPTHVGLYLGSGMMIDAGDPVHIEPVFTGHNARYGRPPGL